jgi:glycerol uptake facilitator-like aquaporin
MQRFQIIGNSYSEFFDTPCFSNMFNNTERRPSRAEIDISSNAKQENYLEPPTPSKWKELNATLEYSDYQACFGEFIGMFIFLFLAIFSAISADAAFAPIVTPIAFGASLTVAILIVGSVSGGHLNPAVTMAMLISGNIKPIRACMYILAQIVGGSLAVGCISWMSSKGYAIPYGAERDLFAGFVAEMVGTWILIMTVFATAVQTKIGEITPAKQYMNNVAPFAIGLVVMVCHFALLGTTGCGINPARYIASAMFKSGFCFTYIIAPFVAAFLAVGTQTILYGKFYQEQ